MNKSIGLLLLQGALVTKEKLSFAMEHGYNVLLIGPHGSGKTTRVRELWEEKGVRFAYFNAPTLDPYVDLIGIPTNDNGQLKFLKSPQMQWDNVEFIFFDEPNRAHKKVINTLYELIQFKSINGQRLPCLRAVWAAMNPSNENYAVESMDQSFIDRFELHYYVQSELSEAILSKKLSTDLVAKVVQWWKSLEENAREKFASPRRVDFAIDVFLNGGDICDVLPASVNPNGLQLLLSNKEQPLVQNDSDGPLSPVVARLFLDNPQQYTHDPNIFLNMLQRCPKEVIAGWNCYVKYSVKERTNIINYFLNVLSMDLENTMIEDILHCFVPNTNVLITLAKWRPMGFGRLGSDTKVAHAITYSQVLMKRHYPSLATRVSIF